jgi:HEXXH motif-containing protein
MRPSLRSGFVLPSSAQGELNGVLARLRLLALRRLLTVAPASLPAELVAPTERLLAAVPRWLRAKPAGLEALDAPEVLTPLLAWHSGALAAPIALSLAVPNLLAGMAAAGGAADRLRWDVPFEQLVEHARSLVFGFRPAAAGLAVSASSVEVRLADGRAFTLAQPDDDVSMTRFLFEITPTLPALRLCTLDLNPLAHVEAHPDKHGNAVSLGGRSVEQWCQSLAQALELVRLALPDLHREMSRSLRRIVPVGYEPEQSLSASYREAPGVVYVTLHPNPVTLAEALIHESQHGKLNALSFFDPILENGHSEWAASPVRPDLRPLMGVLLAAHAFVPVAEFHRRLAELGHDLSSSESFSRRRREVQESNRQALDALSDKARPTMIGQHVMADLSALHAATIATAGT